MSEKVNEIRKSAVNNAQLLNKDYNGSEDLVMATVNGKKPQMVKLNDIKVLIDNEYKTLDFVLKSLYVEISTLKQEITSVSKEYQKLIDSMKGSVTL